MVTVQLERGPALRGKFCSNCEQKLDENEYATMIYDSNHALALKLHTTSCGVRVGHSIEYAMPRQHVEGR